MYSRLPEWVDWQPVRLKPKAINKISAQIFFMEKL